jgi:hypothetical protein
MIIIDFAALMKAAQAGDTSNKGVWYVFLTPRY